MLSSRSDDLLRLITLGLLVILGARAAGQVSTGQYDPIDIQHGARIYAAQCVACHGPTGDQVAGVNLRGGLQPRAATDNQLRNIITSGIPGTAMPAFKLDASELTMIVAYVRNMRDFGGSGGPVGDVARGRGIFEGSGLCSTCHRVNGRGPRLAPDLSDVGSVRSAAQLQKTLLDPSGSILPSNRSVRAVTRDGKVITGRRLNEDTYTVQLIDEGEQLTTLDKNNLRDYEVIASSRMPSYKDRLNAQELADVVGYLLSLKGIN